MQGYVPGEQPGDRSFIKLNTNENPYPPSPLVRSVLAGVEAEDLRLYPDPMATPIRQAVAEAYHVQVEQVLVGNGSDELLNMAVRSFVETGAKVVWPEPTYTLYETLARIQGAVATTIPFNDDFSLPRGLFGNDAPLTIVANPNAPSGTMVSKDELRRLAESLKGMLVIDEAYVDFADFDCLGLASELKNVVVLRTLSKSFSLAGLRVGFAVADKDIIEGMCKVKDSYNVSRLAIDIAEAVLHDTDHVMANCSRVAATRERLTQELQRRGLFVYPSMANFLLVRTQDPPARSVYEELKRRKILVRYFDAERLQDCLRITVGTNGETDIFLEELDNIMK